MADTLLHYAMTTEPFPLQASPASGNSVVAQLTVVATNATSNGVLLQGISVTLPIGDGATQLTSTSNAVAIGPVPPPDWRLAQTQHPPGSVVYIFQPTGGGVSVGAGQALIFVFNNVTVNTAPGTVEIDVMEGSNNCQPPACPTYPLNITKFPNGWGTVSFWVNPPIVPAGDATTLNWAGPAGATYTIEYYTPQSGVVNVPAQGQPALSNQGQYPAQGQPPLTLWETTVFTLNVSETVDGKSYFAQAQQTVTAESQIVTIVSFKAAPNYVPPNFPVSLQWKTQFAVSWEVTPGDISVPVSPPNEQGYQVEAGFQVKPSESVLYYLNAQDSSGNQRSAGAQVTVDPKIFSSSQTVDYTGQTGEGGSPGAHGMDGNPATAGAFGYPGWPGGPGPDLNVTISLFDDWLLQVAVAPSTGPATTLLVAPPAQLTLRSVGGTGGTGGAGGPGGDGESRLCGGGGAMGGTGGAAGGGGSIVVNCPTGLKTQAQSCLVFESAAGTPGQGGEGGPGGHSSRSGCTVENGGSGQPGGSGGVGTVTWHFT